MENSWAIAARLGVLNSTQNTLWYGLIGYTRAEFEARECYWLDFYDSCDRDGGLSVSEDKGGLTVGAGVESLITDALSLKLEYRFTDFGSIRGFDDDVGWSGNGEEGFDFDPVDHSIRAVLSWRFGGIWGN
jgi:opacity protein-like surface antigen